jgi:hypothetical protein
MDTAAFAAALSAHYRIERELGRGGFATVFLAHDLRHERPVALKVLHPEIAATLGTDRFKQEIHLAGRLQHPHILGVIDSGEAANQLWFTMPLIRGESLRQRLQRERSLPVDYAVGIAREVADALGYAHRQGVARRGCHPRRRAALRTASSAMRRSRRRIHVPRGLTYGLNDCERTFASRLESCGGIPLSPQSR